MNLNFIYANRRVADLVIINWQVFILLIWIP